MRLAKIICVFLCSTILLTTLTGCANLKEALRLNLEVSRFEKNVLTQWEKEQLDEPMAVSAKSKEEVTEALLDALSAHDAESLKAMLCIKTQEMSDIDQQIQEVFNHFNGTVISRDDYLSGSEGSSINYGRVLSEERRWFVTDILTDTGDEYEIIIHQYLSAYSYPTREGIVQLNIRHKNDMETIIGYEWTDYYAVARSEAHDIVQMMSDGELTDYWCQRALQLPNIQQQFDAGVNFIEGVPYFRNGNKPMREMRDIRTSYVQEEDVANHEATRVYLELHVENIETDADRIYEMDIYLYYINTLEPELAGIMKIVLYDEAGNSCVIGENFY